MKSKRKQREFEEFGPIDPNTGLSVRARVFAKLLTQIHRVANKNPDTRGFILRLSANQKLTVPQIAKILGKKRQGIQKVVNQLIKEGFCTYAENFFHRKSKLLILT